MFNKKMVFQITAACLVLCLTITGVLYFTVPLTTHASVDDGTWHAEGNFCTDWFDFFPGRGTAQYPFLISTPQELAGLAHLTNQATATATRTRARGAHILLVNDIDLSGRRWIPIDEFTGIFDGQMYKITLSTSMALRGGRFGLFANLTNASVRNLVLDGNVNNFTGTLGLGGGAVAGAMTNSQVYNIISHVDFDFIGLTTPAATSASVGGIVGSASTGARVLNAVNYGSMYNLDGPATLTGANTMHYTGGIVASSDGFTVIINSMFYGSINATRATSVGGIFGTGRNVQIINSHSRGDLQASILRGSQTGIGGIIAVTGGGAAATNWLTNVYSMSPITPAYRIGHIQAASSSGTLTFTDVTGFSNTGTSQLGVGSVTRVRNNITNEFGMVGSQSLVDVMNGGRTNLTGTNASLALEWIPSNHARSLTPAEMRSANIPTLDLQPTFDAVIANRTQVFELTINHSKEHHNIEGFINRSFRTSGDTFTIGEGVLFRPNTTNPVIFLGFASTQARANARQVDFMLGETILMNRDIALYAVYFDPRIDRAGNAESHIAIAPNGDIYLNGVPTNRNVFSYVDIPPITIDTTTWDILMGGIPTGVNISSFVSNPTVTVNSITGEILLDGTPTGLNINDYVEAAVVTVNETTGYILLNGVSTGKNVNDFVDTTANVTVNEATGDILLNGVSTGLNINDYVAASVVTVDEETGYILLNGVSTGQNVNDFVDTTANITVDEATGYILLNGISTGKNINDYIEASVVTVDEETGYILLNGVSTGKNISDFVDTNITVSVDSSTGDILLNGESTGLNINDFVTASVVTVDETTGYILLNGISTGKNVNDFVDITANVTVDKATGYILLNGVSTGKNVNDFVDMTAEVTVDLATGYILLNGISTGKNVNDFVDTTANVTVDEATGDILLNGVSIGKNVNDFVTASVVTIDEETGYIYLDSIRTSKNVADFIRLTVVNGVVHMNGVPTDITTGGDSPSMVVVVVGPDGYVYVNGEPTGISVTPEANITVDPDTGEILVNGDSSGININDFPSVDLPRPSPRPNDPRPNSHILWIGGGIASAILLLGGIFSFILLQKQRKETLKWKELAETKDRV